MEKDSDPSPRVTDITLPLDEAENAELRLRAVAKKIGVEESRIKELRLRKHSIDARKSKIKIQLRFEAGIDKPLPPEKIFKPSYPKVPPRCRTAVIVGCGPAGMFAALRCIELGWKPIILERGKDVATRRFDLGPIMKEGKVDPESNYCFGEGGAGTFSDGKLYTRSKKRGSVRGVYETLVAHGAPRQILVDAHPHIGSNLLPKVVRSIRRSILEAGGEVRFQSKVTGLELTGNRIACAVVNDSEEIAADAFILAAGHSARDVYELLAKLEISLEAKPFAAGFRIEHPQDLIDARQYHFSRGTKRPNELPAASYRLAAKIRGRGVHSFCMCPGGFIVPATTSPELLVVNGMSLSKRNSPFANSGIVVAIEPEDLAERFRNQGPLGGIYFQEELERKALGAGSRPPQVAPGQRVADFLTGRESSGLPVTSYRRGASPERLDRFFPRFIGERLRDGLQIFGERIGGFISNEGVLLGVESRTSSPVRIPRNAKTMRHPQVENLIPCGEGAGYAGGIVSAALDGIRCAESLV